MPGGALLQQQQQQQQRLQQHPQQHPAAVPWHPGELRRLWVESEAAGAAEDCVMSVVSQATRVRPRAKTRAGRR